MTVNYSRFFRYGLLAAVSCFCFPMSGCSYFFNPGGKSPEEVVERYTLALERKEKNSIVRLLPGNSASKQMLLTIDKKLSNFDGFKSKNVKVDYKDLKTVFVRAELEASYVEEGAEKKFTDTVHIRHGCEGVFKDYENCWHLIL